MDQSKDQLYELIKDLRTKEEFYREIKDIINEYDELLDEDTAALLIVDKLNKNKKNISKIKDLEPGMECTVFGKITNISELRNFNRKNGTEGRVINLELTDETGTCGLVLWDKDVELIPNKTIQKGSSVKVINGYIKNGFNGIEINVGRWGLVEIISESIPKIMKERQINEKVITGTLTEIQPTRPFFRDNGEYGFVTKIKLETTDGEKPITLWDEKVKEIQNFKQGDKLEIRNIALRDKNGIKELHINGRSNIIKL
jgi:replication factor A1